MPVYFIGQETHGQITIKIGVARDIEKRRRTLQTGNPNELRLMGWLTSEDCYRLEKQLHGHFRAKRGLGEWFDIEPADILPILQRAGSEGFVAKNADAFEIIGHDKDGVPEYLGVWEWDALEFYECCPFCGCFCGMHFQEASWMYHCLNCDTLTDFSALSSPEADG
jgi:hypothetical protein